MAQSDNNSDPAPDILLKETSDSHKAQDPKDLHVELHRDSEEPQEETSASSSVKKVFVKLPAKLGPLNITSPEQLIQLLKTKSNVQILPQVVEPVDSDVSQERQLRKTENKRTQETFKCTQCEYTSYNKHYLKQHVELVHLAERPFKCPFCDYAGKRSHSLKEHLVVHSSYRPYECHFCNATFRKKGHLTNHIKLHASLSQFNGEQVCKLCGVAFKQVSEFWAHMRESHKGKPEVHVCQSCQFATVDQGEFKIHSWSHGKEKVHQCTACDVVCDKELEMMEHIAEVHKGRASCTVQRPSRQGLVILLKCSECGFSTGDKQVLKEHMYTHLSKEDQQNLKLNEEVQRTGRVCTAGGGGKEAEKAGQLLKKAYECQCGFLAATEEDMLKHVKNTHAQAAPGESSKKDFVPMMPVLLKCSECGFTAEDQAGMKAHMMVHLPQFAKQTPSSEKKVEGVENESPSPKQADASVTAGPTTVYNCAQCKFSSSEAYVFITHMLTHRPMVKSSNTGQGSRFQVPVSSSPEASQNQEAGSSQQQQQQQHQGYVHDMAMGVYRCAICSYMCEHQRTIKAHIWKHSGHKDIDYPMFQNGPLSMFDYTPIGLTKLAAGKSVIAEPKPEPHHTPEQVQAQSDSPLLVLEKLPNDEMEELERRTVNLKTIASAKTILDGHSKQVILVPAKSIERSALLQVNEPAQTVASKQPQTNKALKGLLGSHREVLLAPVTRADPSLLALGEVITGQSQLTVLSEASRKRAHIAAGEENVVPVKRGLVEVSPASPAHVVVEPMSDVYVTPTVNLATLHNKAASPHSPHVGKSESVTVSAGNSTRNCEETGAESTTSAEGGQMQREDLEMEVEVEEVLGGEGVEGVGSYEVVVQGEECEVEEGGCVEVYTSQEDTQSTSSTTTSDASETLATEQDLDPDESSGGSKLHETDDITKEQALTLLSLLKKGPNFNPACPPAEQAELESRHERVFTEQNKARILDHSYRGKKGDSKSGISDSLLAAIEHLRGVSKSDTEMEDDQSSGTNVSVSSSGSKKRRAKAARGGRRRGRRKAVAADGSPIDANKNVEKLARDRLRCKLCHYTTTSSTLMKTHMRVHKAKNPTECSLCDFVSRDSEELQRHILQHCKVRTYQCKYCSSEFSYKSQLRAHMRAHDDRHPLLCESCDYQTWDLAAYQKHIEFCKSSQSVCSACGQKFCSHGELERHQEEGGGECMVAGKGRYQCEQCEFSTENEESYNKHARWHGRTYKCEQCDFVCTNYKGMANHARVHFEEKEQRCEYCDFVAKSVRSLKSHMKRHANDQRFVQQPLEQYMCNLCGYVCHHLPSLKSHMWRHASDTNYSYTCTNAVINAAIDYDSSAPNADTPASTKADPDQAHTDTSTPEAGDGSTEAGIDRNNKSLITFCCCQCGFESTDKAVLNSHMKVHNDIIQKTLAVNMGRFALHTTPQDNTASKSEQSQPEVQFEILTEEGNQ